MNDIETILKQYKNFVLTLASQKSKEGRIGQGIVGLATEAGEMLDTFKKFSFQERPYDITNLKEECGDALFYLTELMATIDTDITEVINMNVKKLKSRYPDGKFDKDMSLFRDLDNERRILEENEDSPLACIAGSCNCGHCHE